jgi:hypothetical protein
MKPNGEKTGFIYLHKVMRQPDRHVLKVLEPKR